MTIRTSTSRLSVTLAGRTFAALSFSAVLLATTGAVAGECPADQVLAEPAELEHITSDGVTRELLASVDLTGWRDLGNFMLRTRRLTIEPHGLVPYHTHDERPSIVYIVNGELIEHSALCAVPIRHVAGDTAPEFGHGHNHWWENPTDEPVVVLSSDVVPFERREDQNM